MRRVSAFALALPVAFALVAAACAPSHSKGKNAAISGATLAIVNGTLIDGTGAAPLRRAAVLVKGRRIVYAGPQKGVVIPEGARRLDARGGTILPGFINTHVHQAVDDSALRSWLLGGVTTVRDLGSGLPYEDVFDYRDQLNRSNRQARLLAVGPIVTVPDGYPQTIFPLAPLMGLPVTSVKDARAKTEKLIAAGCDTVKIAVESGKVFRRSGLPRLSVAEIRAIVEVAHAHGIRVTAHAIVNSDIERAVRGGVDEIAHGDIENAPQSLIERMVAAHIDWIPTLELYHLAGVNIAGDSLKRFVRAGGVVALGTDYDGYPGVTFDLGMPVNELLYMRQAGMTPMQVIQASTSNAAYAVGHPELGLLEPGKVADAIAVRGNPLRNLSAFENLILVVHNGVVVESKLR
jgi:imidazolonepropionase-like amidohydrolase